MRKNLQLLFLRIIIRFNNIYNSYGKPNSSIDLLFFIKLM